MSNNGHLLGFPNLYSDSLVDTGLFFTLDKKGSNIGNIDNNLSVKFTHSGLSTGPSLCL